MTKGKMENKRVLITGSGTGIGRGMAIQFAQEGADVVLHYSHSSDGAKSAVDEITKAGGKAQAFKADFTNIDEVKELPVQAAEFLGGLDVLVNNAGITMNMPFEKATPDQFDTLFNVNIKAMYFITQASLPFMYKAGGGHIVNMTSNHAFGALIEHTIYSSTKAAIVAFTRSLGVELAQKGIHVNAIASGWVYVENQQNIMPDLDTKKAGLSLPAGFIAKPTDIGNLAMFLASDESKFMVGETVMYDGGQTALINRGDYKEALGVQFGKGYVKGI